MQSAIIFGTLSKDLVAAGRKVPTERLCRDTEVIGYYCLSAGAISHEASPKAMRRNMPDPLPVLLLGRLAIDKRYQNLGIGRALLRDAMIRAINVARDAGVFAILVHAISDQARQFYLSRGLSQSPLQPMTLLMTIETMRSVLSEPFAVTIGI